MSSDACRTIGIGPDSFDCSGFVIRSISDVLDQDPLEWPADVRHVRDMWSVAHTETHKLRLSDMADGALLVTQRRYTIDGQARVIPGHIGIISQMSNEEISIIHASPGARKVEERPIRTKATILGSLSLMAA